MQIVRRLVPNFIIEKYKADEMRGTFQGAAIFMDMSGFSRMTDALSTYGQRGAEALAGLSQREREVTVLRYYLGFDVAVTAGILGVSDGTVKTLLFRARRELAAALGEQDDEEVQDRAGLR